MPEKNLDKYKLVEKKLRDYEMMKARIDILKKEIKLTELECGISGISYDKINTSCTNLISNLTADTALSKTEAIHFLDIELNRLKYEIEKIDRGLEALNETEREILILFYIHGREWWYISDKLKFSPRQCRRKRDYAIEKLIMAFIG